MGSTHIAQGHDFQIRAQWKPRTVVLWDSKCYNLSDKCTDDETESRRIAQLEIIIPPRMGSGMEHVSPRKPKSLSCNNRWDKRAGL